MSINHGSRKVRVSQGCSWFRGKDPSQKCDVRCGVRPSRDVHARWREGGTPRGKQQPRKGKRCRYLFRKRKRSYRVSRQRSTGVWRPMSASPGAPILNKRLRRFTNIPLSLIVSNPDKCENKKEARPRRTDAPLRCLIPCVPQLYAEYKGRRQPTTAEEGPDEGGGFFGQGAQTVAGGGQKREGRVATSNLLLSLRGTTNRVFAYYLVHGLLGGKLLGKERDIHFPMETTKKGCSNYES